MERRFYLDVINKTTEEGIPIKIYTMKKPPKKVGLQLNGTVPPNPLSESQRIFIYGQSVS